MLRMPWNQGIVYCTCGHFLRENKSSRHHHRWQLDILSIPNYVIKKVRPHGNRHGKTEATQKLIGLKQNASRWTRWRREISPVACSPRSTRDIRKTWSISLNTSGRNAPMKLRSDLSEALTKMHRLHREPIFFHQYQRWHLSSSSSSTSWWQWNDHWWSS